MGSFHKGAAMLSRLSCQSWSVVRLHGGGLAGAAVTSSIHPTGRWARGKEVWGGYH